MMRLLIVLILALSACAPQKLSGICMLKSMGNSETGIQFIRYHCEPAEE